MVLSSVVTLHPVSLAAVTACLSLPRQFRILGRTGPYVYVSKKCMLIKIEHIVFEETFQVGLSVLF